VNGLEYGAACGFITALDGRSVPPPVFRKSASRYETKVIDGIATKYNYALFHDGKLKVIMPGAFDISMEYDAPVEMWIDHDKSLKIGDSRTNLELHSDEYGLGFRLRLDNSTLASHARSLVESKAYTEMSVGYDHVKTDTREIGGKSVLFILQARLQEISLVQAGCVTTTHAQISDIDTCGSLALDCKSMKFRVDNSYAELQRKLRNLTTVS
jgi:HK97 family phage prohead protease